jgi:lipoprotein-anchoring transpeptidase ErfK/SrfK
MKFRSVALVLVAAMGLAKPAIAQSLSQYGMWGEPPASSFKSNLGALPKGVALASGGARPDIGPEAPQTAEFANGYAPGSIVIDTAGRKLYYTLSANQAYVYPVAVGKQGFTWSGVEKVSKIEDWPDWIPPAEMRARKPSLPVRMTGGLKNPLGVKAIYLGSTLYRIHGTNDADSIGEAASSGCFRMHNGHVVHLAGLVNANTTVYVLKRLPKGGVPGAPAVAPAEAKPVEPAHPAPASDQKI